MKQKCIFDMIVWIIVIIGALNWGLVGVFHFDLVAFIFGDMSMGSRIVYGLVGLAGIGAIFSCARKCAKGNCGEKDSTK